MRPGTILYSSLILLFSCLLIGIGLFIIFASQTPLWEDKLIRFLEEQRWGFTWVGLIITSLGGVCIFGFFKVFKRQYYILSMDATEPVSLDVEIIRKDLAGFLMRVFPNQPAFCEVIVQEKTKRLKFQQLEFFADLPYVTFEERESILTAIESYLKGQLEKLYGYRTEFLFNVSFKEHH